MVPLMSPALTGGLLSLPDVWLATLPLRLLVADGATDVADSDGLGGMAWACWRPAGAVAFSCCSRIWIRALDSDSWACMVLTCPTNSLTSPRKSSPVLLFAAVAVFSQSNARIAIDMRFNIGPPGLQFAEQRMAGCACCPHFLQRGGNGIDGVALGLLFELFGLLVEFAGQCAETDLIVLM